MTAIYDCINLLKTIEPEEDYENILNICCPHSEFKDLLEELNRIYNRSDDVMRFTELVTLPFHCIIQEYFGEIAKENEIYFKQIEYNGTGVCKPEDFEDSPNGNLLFLYPDEKYCDAYIRFDLVDGKWGLCGINVKMMEYFDRLWKEQFY